MRMTEALRQVAENVQEMKKDRTGNPTTMKDAEKEAVKKAVSKIKSTGMSYSDWEKTTTFGPRLKQAVKMQVEEVELDEGRLPKYGSSVKYSTVMKKIKDGTWEASTDVKPRSSLEIRDTESNKKTMIQVEEVELDEEWIDVSEAVSVLNMYKS